MPKNRHEYDEYYDRELASPNNKGTGLHPMVQAAVVAAIGGIIVALIGAIPVGSSERPLACSFDANIFNGIYNCNGIIGVGILASPMPNVETSIPQTLTAIATSTIQPSITTEPTITTTLSVTSTPTNTAVPIFTPTNSPTNTPRATRTPDPVVYVRFGAGRLDTYSVTIGADEIIVGNANTLSLSGSVNKNIENRCIVYSLRGPGTWTITVTNGSIKHFRDVTDTLALTYYQTEEDALVQNSGGDCGTTTIPIYHFQVNGTNIVRDSGF